MQAFADVKDNCDSGQFMAIQKAAAVALDDATIPVAVRTKYERRLKKLVAMLSRVGFDCRMPGGIVFPVHPQPEGDCRRAEIRNGRGGQPISDHRAFDLHGALGRRRRVLAVLGDVRSAGRSGRRCPDGDDRRAAQKDSAGFLNCEATSSIVATSTANVATQRREHEVVSRADALSLVRAVGGGPGLAVRLPRSASVQSGPPAGDDGAVGPLAGSRRRQRRRFNFYGPLATSIFLIGWGTGGLAFGVLGDRIGRAKTMLWTILLYSLFTGLSALSVGFWDFAFYRFLTGLGVGGEFAVGVALVAEVMPNTARPYALGLLQALSAVGNASAALINIGTGHRRRAMALSRIGPSAGIRYMPGG